MPQSALRALDQAYMMGMGQGPAPVRVPKTRGQTVADMLGAAAIGTTPIPIVSDITGMAADLAMYAAYPEKRTIGNYAMSALGGLPLIPGAAAVRAVREGPDMSAAARMQRAQNMGFDTERVFYHGTGEDFLEFDPLKMGKTDEGWFGKGFYFSPKPEIANQYAAGRSPNVQQVYLKAKNPYDWRKNIGAGMRLGTAEERYAKTKEIIDQGYDAVDVYSDQIKIGQDEMLPDNVFLAIAQRAQSLGDPIMPRSMIESALKSGIDYGDFARHYGNDIASMMPLERTLMERVVFDPKNIRSINAAFDPARRSSANLMAGVGGAAVLGGTAATYKDNQRNDKRKPD